MAEVIKLVQGDTRPNLIANLVDSNNGDTPVNVSSCQVKLYFTEQDDTKILDTLEGLIIDAPNGQVLFPFNQATLNEPGDYQGELEITFPDGTVQTVFEFVYFVVREQTV